MQQTQTPPFDWPLELTGHQTQSAFAREIFSKAAGYLQVGYIVWQNVDFGSLAMPSMLNPLKLWPARSTEVIPAAIPAGESDVFATSVHFPPSLALRNLLVINILPHVEHVCVLTLWQEDPKIRCQWEHFLLVLITCCFTCGLTYDTTLKLLYV